MTTKEKERPKINLLWTGGLDSTFRLWELSRHEVDVQPYYIIDPTRGSIPQEKRAMEKVLGLLRNNSATKANINDVEFIEFSSIQPDEKITKSWKFFNDWNQLGTQYDYLARFAKQKGIKLEVGLEGSVRGKCSNVLKTFGNLKKGHYPLNQYNILIIT